VKVIRGSSITTLAALVLAGCRASPPAGERTPEPPKPPPAEQPPTAPPANVSHGEAPVGSTSLPAPVDPEAPPRSATRLHHVRLEILHTNTAIAKGTTYYAWTFGGSVPGPVIRVTQGDTVDFTLVNKAPQPHSMDFHAAEIAPSRYYVNVNPGDSLHYRFVARVPGVFMYHCGTAPVAMHIANGMYGAFIVDPAVPRPAAKEFALVQSEFYLTPDDGKGGLRSLDWQKLLSLAPDHVVFNGRAAQYADHPVAVKPGQLLRLYVVNAGPNRISSFHVVGGIFEKVFEDGSVLTPLRGVQTVNVPVGGGAIFEIRLREPGDYPFVTHAFADATKGAVGILRAEGEGRP
jgi:nitrite reductase (NO-forming)